MTPADRDRLLEHLASLSTRTRSEDTSRLATSLVVAVVLAVLDGGLLPGDVLELRVRDCVRRYGGSERSKATHWEIRRSVRVRGTDTILPLSVRTAWLIYLGHAIAHRRITRIDERPFFAVPLRTLQYQFKQLARRAGLPALTFHALRAAAPARTPRRRRATPRRAARKPPSDGQSTPRPMETAPTLDAPQEARNATDPQQTPHPAPS